MLCETEGWMSRMSTPINEGVRQRVKSHRCVKMQNLTPAQVSKQTEVNISCRGQAGTPSVCSIGQPPAERQHPAMMMTCWVMASGDKGQSTIKRQAAPPSDGHGCRVECEHSCTVCSLLCQRLSLTTAVRPITNYCKLSRLAQNKMIIN